MIHSVIRYHWDYLLMHRLMPPWSRCALWKRGLFFEPFCFGALLSALLLAGLARGQAPHGTVRGDVFSTAADGGRLLMPGARVLLTPIPGAHPPGFPPLVLETKTDAASSFVFENVLSGRYQASAVSADMRGTFGELFLVAPGGVVDISIEMKVAPLLESVEISAVAEPVDAISASASGTILASTLRDAPSVTERFDDLLPLLPGVVRGPDGLINMKGARAAQSGILVNSANVTDPVTGEAAINLPVDVVSEVTVLSSPYDPQYGKFAGAISSVNTQVADFRRFRFNLQNPLPSLRKRDGRSAGIEKVKPRVTLSGPVISGRLMLTQALEYRYIRTEIEQAGLPPLERDTELESFDSFTQADLQINERHTAGLSLSFYPQKQNYFGLGTFLPQVATPNLRQRGHMVGFQDTYAFYSGALLKSRVNFKTFNADVRANSLTPYRVGIETAEGGFFNIQDRDTSRLELEEIYNFAPRWARGQHLLKAGFLFNRSHYDGDQSFGPVDILGSENRLVERIVFGEPVEVGIEQNEFAFFLQDRWTVRPRLTLDFGLRTDADSVTKGSHLAPRFGFSYLLTNDTRTVVRGGVGLFYDRVNAAIPTFSALPARTAVRFDAASDFSVTQVYSHRAENDEIRAPFSVSWSAQIDRELTRRWFLRVGFQQRNTRRNFFLEPESAPEGSYLALRNDGRDRYRELELTTRYRLSNRAHLTASYVHSSAIGDLNDFNTIYGNVARPVIRQNERARLAFDAPNRFLFWADLDGPYGTVISPIVDVHTGFPYSVVDEQRNFVGPRNSTAQFPRFAAVDLQIVREIPLPIKEGLSAEVGVRVFNLLNHFNPVEVQNNLASPRFGSFFNSRKRDIDLKFSIDF